jgi:hypothetical protein
MKGQPLSERNSAIITALMLAGIFILAGLLPIHLLWGFNHLQYFSAAFIITLIIIFLAALIPRVNERIYSLCRRISDTIHKLPRWLQVVMIGSFAFAVFYILRVHVHSLGDGYQRIYQIERGYYFYHTELLDFFLHSALYRILHSLANSSAETTYIIFSIFCGIVFVLAVYRFKSLDDQFGRNVGLVKFLIISMGGIQLFCGYVESYSLFYTAMLLYIFYAVRFINTGKGITATSISFALAFMAHLTGVFFIPSFLYICYIRIRAEKKIAFLGRYFPLIILCVSAVVVASLVIWAKLRFGLYISSFQSNILPLFSPSGYCVFSLEHFLDIGNEILLIAPVAVLAALLLIAGRSSLAINRPLKYFFVLVASFAGLFLLITDPKLGFARDWDMFSTPTAALGSIVMILYAIKDPVKSHGNYIKTLIAILALIFTATWVLTNSSTKRQLARAEELLNLSERGRGYGTELLAFYYLNEARNSRKALELYNGISGESKNARVYGNIAQIEYDSEHYRDALNSARKGMTLDSNETFLQYMAGAALTKMDSLYQAYPYLLKARNLEPNNPVYNYDLGQVYYRIDSIQPAINAFREVIRIDPKAAPAYFSAGQAFLLIRQYDSAFAYTQKGLKIKPDDTEGWKLMDLIKHGAVP